MEKPAYIRIEEYDYHLPAEKIAKFPLEQRDLSKLLILKNNNLSQSIFKELPSHLPVDSLLVFNETKVIQARLQFIKPTGAQIEIFCLEPVEPNNDFQIAFTDKSPVIWKCLVGNSKRWKNNELTTKITIENEDVFLSAKKLKRLNDSFLIEFKWSGNRPFLEILDTAGKIPLPPYLGRKPVDSDKERYQTVYAKQHGSVAAPTAGLHFTRKIFQEIEKKGIKTEKVTLHVGAGTFKPVSSDKIGEHEMHTEKIIVKKETLENLLKNIDKTIIPVGTTSMRTLESLFWIALKLKNNNDIIPSVKQWDPYELRIPNGFDVKTALETLIEFLEKNNFDELKSETKLMIAPGYNFKLAKGLITNFHQPKSTLLLLVSALIGERWKDVYNYALKNNFRFLSYGDSCLFLP